MLWMQKDGGQVDADWKLCGFSKRLPQRSRMDVSTP